MKVAYGKNMPTSVTDPEVVELLQMTRLCIPAGTMVFGNHWSISRDPDVYMEPYAFKPQHWIDEQGGLRDD
ncbi:hypothetical protein BDR05DRAFT_999433 [Suillus weaverae]|nr:hypothetical protein BDR05DRAFT_999433 [Suillus weaverae]